ncbi:arylesterase [Shewanella algae]|uniref:arylesterase n=1 Tax=Shewanella algae TaxID=38313 RepID=UPI0008DEA5B8|nr:arylesterase [Shewanella algae]OHY53172.1 arylesterase [Shewanella algae]
MALFFKIASLCLRPLALIPVIFLFSALPVKAADVLILGDSLGASYGMAEKQGWVEGLRQALPEHNIVNASVSGETTAGGLRRLPQLLKSVKPSLLLVELGGNDGLRGFPPTELKNNLTKIIALAHQSGAKVLLSEVMVPPNYGPRYANAFSAVYSDLAKQPNVTLMPFFMTEIAPFPELMLADGLHPNEKAQPKITAFVLPWVESAIEAIKAPATDASAPATGG